MNKKMDINKLERARYQEMYYLDKTNHYKYRFGFDYKEIINGLVYLGSLRFFTDYFIKKEMTKAEYVEYKNHFFYEKMGFCVHKMVETRENHKLKFKSNKREFNHSVLIRECKICGHREFKTKNGWKTASFKKEDNLILNDI